MAKTSARRAARIRAFQILFGLSYVPADSPEELRRAYVHSPTEGDSAPPKAPGEDSETVLIGDADWEADGDGPAKEDFAWELVFGVWSNKAELDEVIGRFSQHWKVSRIARVELTILRLALFEMIERPDIPLKVAINEAVELAKLFGDGHSGNFVNGILDAAARAIEHGDFGIRKGI